MKNLILTISFPKEEKVKKMYEISQFSIKQYADKVKCDFIILTNYKYQKEGFPVHIEKLQIGDYLKYYDKILFLDSDILITPNASNIFEQYSENKIYGFNEGFLYWVKDDITKFEKIFNIEFPKYLNDPVLLNGGVMLYSKSSIPLFNNFSYNDFVPSFEIGGEQTYFNYLIHKLQLPFSSIDPYYNYMIYSDKAKFNNRFEAYFIHYAADGYWINECSKYEQIEKDFKILEQL